MSRAVDADVDDENQTFREVTMPRYREMISIFRDKMWLAEPATREFFGKLIEFVDVWEEILERFPKRLNRGIPMARRI